MTDQHLIFVVDIVIRQVTGYQLKNDDAKSIDVRLWRVGVLVFHPYNFGRLSIEKNTNILVNKTKYPNTDGLLALCHSPYQLLSSTQRSQLAKYENTKLPSVDILIHKLNLFIYSPTFYTQ